MTEPRTDHRVSVIMCAQDDSDPLPCDYLRDAGKCPDKNCLGWVD